MSQNPTGPALMSPKPRSLAGPALMGHLLSVAHPRHLSLDLLAAVEVRGACMMGCYQLFCSNGLLSGR